MGENLLRKHVDVLDTAINLKTENKESNREIRVLSEMLIEEKRFLLFVYCILIFKVTTFFE